MSSTNNSMISQNGVYDRGRNQTNNSIEQGTNSDNNRVFRETQTSIPSINIEDLKLNVSNQIGSTKTGKKARFYLNKYFKFRHHFKFQAIVYYGTMRSNGTKEKVAIKQLASATLQEIIRSIGPWAHIKHSNVIEIKGFCFNEDQPNQLPLIVMEYGKGGLLKDFIRNIGIAIPFKIQVMWSLQIINGMIEIHKNNVIHRDLASGNIVMTNNGQTEDQMEKTILKIIDINDQNTFGTPLNMSPESFDNKITKESEVFSFGSILWEIVTRHREKPFVDIDMELDEFNECSFAICVAIDNKPLNIPDYCDPRLADIIHKCRHQKPEKRPTFAELELKLKEILKTDLAANIVPYNGYETECNDSEVEIEFDAELDDESTDDDNEDVESTDDDNEDVESTDTPDSDDSNEDYHNFMVSLDRANVPFLF